MFFCECIEPLGLTITRAARALGVTRTTLSELVNEMCIRDRFEATDARRAFPSFDEPAFKATYDVSLVIDAADTAISNSPIETDTPGPAAAKHTLKFFTTPKMSTYLVAFLVGDFQCTAGSQDGVAIRVCSTPDKVALTPYGVDIAKYVLHYYNTYFGIPYPLKTVSYTHLGRLPASANNLAIAPARSGTGTSTTSIARFSRLNP